MSTRRNFLKISSAVAALSMLPFASAETVCFEEIVSPRWENFSGHPLIAVYGKNGGEPQNWAVAEVVEGRTGKYRIYSVDKDAFLRGERVALGRSQLVH